MSDTTQIPRITFNDGNAIPQLGFGVFKIDPEDTAEAVDRAFEVGYRHIDTAQMYGNERQVGEAIAGAGLAREEIWVTSKLDNNKHRPDDARRAFERTLTDLQLDQIDLFLIHWPLPMYDELDFVTTWKVLEEFKADSRARSIGVSNFQIPHLEQLLAEADVVPAVCQVEMHPYFLNDEVRTFAMGHGMAIEAWSPIAKGDVLEDDTIAGIAARIGRSPAQVVLRWHIQRGDIVFPKSVTASRVRENFALFDFALSEADMQAIGGLDKGEDGRTGPHPDTMDAIPDD